VLLGFFLVLSLLAYFATKLEIDASSETLLLEDDQDLEFTRKISKHFYSPDMLIITYSPNEGDIFSNRTLEDITALSKELEQLESTASVMSILNVPLLQSPPKPVKELLKNIPTLQSPDVNKTLAKDELLTSPIYSKNLVSQDFKTTAVIVNLVYDEKYTDLINQRNDYLALSKKTALSDTQKRAFQAVKKELKQYRDSSRVKTHHNIQTVRAVIQKYKQHATLHLGGVSMIADDMVTFVKSDLSTFGTVVFVILIFILWIIFREIRWIYIPIFICIASVIATSGLLGMFGWEVTVISSNFISLQLIITMSLVIHLTVKYRELVGKHLHWGQDRLVFYTVLSMAKPSFFVIVTTIAGFSSLVFSQIVPIINFGWMMSAGVAISLVITFIVFPSILLLLPKSQVKASLSTSTFTLFLASIAKKHKYAIVVLTAVTVLFSLSGAAKLFVENSFIDYFKKETEIYKGMKVIDQNLGGTTPLDVVITFKDEEVESVEAAVQPQEASAMSEEADEEDDFEDFEDEFEIDASQEKQYWFTKAKMDKIKQVHDYLDAMPQIGKVLSLATVGEVGKVLNNGKELDSFTLALLYNELPQEYKKIVIDPYVNLEHSQVRISTRIIDSMPDIRRDELIKKINRDLSGMLNPQYEEYRVSNLLVLYNNMLQSLFDSQIKTLGAVLLVIFIMFLILFRNFKVALIAIIANATPVSVIFGFMGWGHIPLDLMTITIAAISIGIAVDNTIHYIHRFKIEYAKSRDYTRSLTNAHSSIGNAMYYTAMTIMIGFSVLMLSNFVPTVYFGMLTVIAMLMAIAADLLLLPVLLILIKPFHCHPDQHV
jgi:predicted RND superfamily exporter protein